VIGVERVGADVADAHPLNRDARRAGDLALDPVQVCVHRVWFPPRVCEHGDVVARYAALGRQQ
jgi:hypothetical protein